MPEPRDNDSLPSVSQAGGASPTPGPPPQITGYEIIERIGEGGMGSVWRAVQLSTRREVALKILGISAFASDKARARFEREVELTAKLEHPNIARVYDSGVQAGICYYAMELVKGAQLADHVAGRDLTQRQILQLMHTVCAAVRHAHLRGVIHRDLKPANIMVTDDGRPQVLDFGLAKAFLSDDSGPTISIEGDVTGTPAYMSPEQAAGRVTEVDTRSDVYSLGVILFRLLTGELPHGSSGTRYELLRRAAEEDVRRPRELSKAIDRELEALLLKALAHDADERYASAGDLALDISNYLAGEPLAARKPTTAYFLARRIRKHRVRVAAVGIVLAALAALAVWAYVSIAEERNRAQLAAESERRARLELEAKVLQDQGQYARAEELYREALATRQRTLGDDHPDTLRSMSNIAVVLQQQHKHAEAEKLHRQTLAARRRTLGRTHADTLESIHDLGLTLLRQGRYGEAEGLLRESLEGRRKTLGEEHPDTLATVRMLAFVLRTQVKYAEAEALYRRVLEATQRALGSDHRRTFMLMNGLARVLQQAGKHAEAEKLLREALDVMVRVLGREHPFTLYAMDSLISVLKYRGKDKEAEKLIALQTETLQRLNQQPKQATTLAVPDEDD